MRLYEFNNDRFSGKTVVGVGDHLLTVEIGNIVRADFVHENMKPIIKKSNRHESVFNILGTGHIDQWYQNSSHEESIKSIQEHFKKSDMPLLSDHLSEINPKIGKSLSAEWLAWLKEEMWRKAHAIGYDKHPNTKLSMKSALHAAHPALHSRTQKPQVRHFMSVAWPIMFNEIKASI